MTLQIDTNVPAPQRVRRGPTSRYLFDQMQPGNSFAFDLEDSENVQKKVRALHAAACNWSRRNGSSAKFTVQARSENEEGLADVNGTPRIRVWRIS